MGWKLFFIKCWIQFSSEKVHSHIYSISSSYYFLIKLGSFEY